MSILYNSKIVLGNVPGLSVNKRDKSYMPTQFCENSQTNMETHVVLQASIFVMR